jgi:hypothetical protein
VPLKVIADIVGHSDIRLTRTCTSTCTRRGAVMRPTRWMRCSPRMLLKSRLLPALLPKALPRASTDL